MDSEATQPFETQPTLPAFENMPTLPLLGNDCQRFDYRLSILESARAQDQRQGGQEWQPYALGAGGILCLVVAALAVKGHVSTEVVVGGLVVIGLFCLIVAASYAPPTPGLSQSNA